MFKILGTLFIISISFVTIGQTFKGLILSQTNQKSIPYCKVYFPDLKTGTISDFNGQFKIENYPQKSIHIQISAIGYQSINTTIKIDSLRQKTFYLIDDHLTLKEVVISNSSGKLQGENIVSVTHKKVSELQETSPLTLAEAISNIPGVDQNTTGTGIGKPVIRGLSGNRIVTYAQGIRIENQQWGSEHGLGVGDIGIESVEIIKGPASLLYGSDALGGVIYFIDERYAMPHTFETSLQSTFLSNSLGSSNKIGLKLNEGKLKLNLFGAFTTHTDYQTTALNRVHNTRFNEINIKGAMGYNVKNWITNLRYSYLQNNYGIIEDSAYSLSNQRNFTLPFQTIFNQNLTFENIIFLGHSKLDFKLGYTNNYRKEFENDANDHALGLKLKTYTYNLKWYSPRYKNIIEFVVGSQGMVQQNSNDGQEILIPNATVKDIGLFALTNIYFKKWQLQGGLRADSRAIKSVQMITNESIFPAFQNQYESLTLSSGAVYKLKKLKFRANISSAFRAPNASELLSNGVHEGTNRYEIGNTNLTHETATQIDFSLNYQNEHFNFSVNPFYNAINNYIYLSPNAIIIEDNPVFEYLQTNAILYGGEIGFHYHPHRLHWLHIESNLSTVFAEDKNKNPLPLIPQTKTNSTLSAEFTQKGKFQLKKIFVQHIYKFHQNRTGIFETFTDDYHLINLGLKLDLKTKANPVEISLGVKNALNTGYIDHLSRFKSLGIENPGINFYIGLSYKFHKHLK